MNAVIKQDNSLQSKDSLHEDIRNVFLFEDIKDNSKAINEIASLMKVKEFDDGANILTQGETGSEMFILIKGTVNIYRTTGEGDPFIVASLTDKNYPFFGEATLLDDDARSATITATSKCSCLVLDRTEFEKFSELYPQWALPIFKKIAGVVMSRLRKINQEFVLLYNALVTEIRES